MATHTLAILVEAIGAAKASKDLKGVERTVSNIGSHAGRGLRTAASNLVGIGAIAGAGIAVAVKTGLDDLATLESAVTSVDGAIKQMGLTGQVTGQQVAGWANDIEASVQAAFDDKDITKATATLVRFGHLAPKNIKPAMVVMTDLAVKTGSVDSAATLLSKALADPTKASGKLARAGVILTKQQQKQIDTLVKAGKVSEAQALIIESVGRVTKDAAKNSVGPYGDAINELSDASEDARKALAIGFLPVIEKVANLLSTELAKPEVLKGLQDFGTTLAGGLDSAIDIARNLPWGAIGDAFKVAGQGAKIVLGAFTSMPPWIQTAVLTGWGLNKISGGALGDIVGELAKGLIKGVLGITAAVVNVNGGVVNGGGGVPGALTGAGEAVTGGGLLAGGVAVALTAGTIAAFSIALVDAMTNHPNADGAIARDANGNIKPGQVFSTQHGFGRPPNQQVRVTNPDQIAAAINEFRAGERNSAGGNVSAKAAADTPAIKAMQAKLSTILDKLHAATRAGRTAEATALRAHAQALKARIDASARVNAAHLSVLQDKEAQSISAEDRIHAAAEEGKAATQIGTSGTTSAVNTARASIVSAITGFRIPAPIVTVTVGPGSVTKSVTTQNRAGPANGSAGGGTHGSGGLLPG